MAELSPLAEELANAFRADRELAGDLSADRELAETFRLLFGTVTARYEEAGQAAPALRLLGAGRELADVQGPPEVSVEARLLLAKVLTDEGEHEAAARYGAEAVQRAEELGHETLLAMACEQLGITLKTQGRFGDAVTTLERANSLRRKNGNARGLLFGLINLGNTQLAAGRPAEAAAAYQGALAEGDTSQIELVAEAQGALSVAYRRMGELERAIRAGEQAVTLERSTGEPARIVRSYENLAELLAEQGNLPGAARLRTEAVQLRDLLPGERGDVARSRKGLADLYARMGRDEIATSLAPEEESPDENGQATSPTSTVKPKRSYGYTAADPIKVGGGLLLGARNQRQFLEELSGPNGEPLSFVRLQSVSPQGEGARGPIDIYEIRYEGNPEPILLYLDMYRRESPVPPWGFIAGQSRLASMKALRAAWTTRDKDGVLAAAEKVLGASQEREATMTGLGRAALLLSVARKVAGVNAVPEALSHLSEAVQLVERNLGEQHPTVRALREAVQAFAANPERGFAFDSQAQGLMPTKERTLDLLDRISSKGSERFSMIVDPRNASYAESVRVLPGPREMTEKIRLAAAGHSAGSPAPSLSRLRFVAKAGLHSTVRSISYSRDLRRALLTAGSAVELWDLPADVLLAKLDLETEATSALEVSDGLRIVSGDAGEEPLTIWDVASAEAVTRHRLKSRGVFSLAQGSSESVVLVGGGDGIVRGLELESGRVRRLYLGHRSPVKTLSVSPGGVCLASSDEAGLLKVWEMESGRHLRTFEGVSPAAGIAFIDDDTVIAPQSDGWIGIFEVASGRLRKKLWHPWLASDPIRGLAADRSGLIVSCTHRSGNRRTWDVTAANLLNETAENNQGPIAVSSDGKTILTSTWQGIQEAASRGAAPATSLKRPSGGVRFVSFSADGRRLCTGGTDGIHIWDLQSCGLLSYIACPPGYSMAVSTDSRRVLLNRHHQGCNELVSLEMETGTTTRLGVGIVADALAFSKDGGLAAVGMRNIFRWNSDEPESPTLAIWAPEERRHLYDLPSFTDVNSVHFFDEDRRLLTGGQDGLLIWNLEKRSLEESLERPSGEGREVVAASADGRWGAAVRDLDIDVWDLETRRRVSTLSGHQWNVSSLAFSQDGRLLASTGGDRSCRVWDIPSGNLLGVHVGHVDWVDGVAFSPSGRHVASCSNDGTVRLFNRQTGSSVVLVTSGREWLAVSDGGWFDASALGARLGGAVRGLEAFSVDQIALRRNRPDLLLKEVALGTPELDSHFYAIHQRRLAKLGLSGVDNGEENLGAPRVASFDGREDGGLLSISGRVESGGAELVKYQVFVNGVPAFGDEYDGRAVTGQSAEIQETLELPSGTNRVELAVMDRSGVQSLRAQRVFTVRRRDLGRAWFVGFGVSMYLDHPAGDLSYAHKDAADLEGYFSRVGGSKVFASSETRTYLDQDVTRAAFRDAKRWLEAAQVDDTIVIFVAGHGSQTEGADAAYYFHPHDVKLDDVARSAVSFAEIAQLCHGSRCMRRLILMDTCQSGERVTPLASASETVLSQRGLRVRGRRRATQEAARDPRRAFPLNRDRYIYSDVSRGTGVVVFASSLDTEPSLEFSVQQNGAFTAGILSALSVPGADSDGDGVVTLNDLKTFVEDIVPRLTGQIQHPTLDRGSVLQDVRFPVV